MCRQVGALSVWGDCFVSTPSMAVVHFVVCRRISPDWAQATELMRNLQQAINGTKYQEPTQELVSLPLWPRRAHSRCRCGIGEPSPVADVGLTTAVFLRNCHSQVLGAVLGLNANIQKTSVGFTGFVCLFASLRHHAPRFNRSFCSFCAQLSMLPAQQITL